MNDIHQRARSTAVNSATVGDPARFLALDELLRRYRDLSRPQRDTGRVVMVVRRVEAGRREVLDEVFMTPEVGVPGDAWGRRAAREVSMQIAVMEAGVAALIANSQPLTLFGDNLFLDLDLSGESLAVGASVRVGEAILEVTPKPHTGCRKFEARFGNDAWRFVRLRELKRRNLRGIYMRVVSSGRVQSGDTLEVLR